MHPESTTQEDEKLYCGGIGFKEMPYSTGLVTRIARDFGIELLERVNEFKKGIARKPDGLMNMIFEDDFAFHILPIPTQVIVERNRVRCPFLRMGRERTLRCSAGIPYKGTHPPCKIGISFEHNGIDPMRWHKNTDNWFIASTEKI